MTLSVLATALEPVAVSGERFAAEYLIEGDERTARARAEELCIEQTVEFPPDLITRSDLSTAIFGRVEALTAAPDGRWRAIVSFADELVGGELTQLLNVLFGNTSLKPGIRLDRLALSPGILASFAGPRYGRAGLRHWLGGARLGVDRRPLLATAVKPLGLRPTELARLAHAFASGGIDVVKDDHGLADQPFCRFVERVRACAAAVADANARTGRRCLYAPNVTGSPELAHERAHLAREAGAGALLIAPGLCGWDVVRNLARDDTLALPLLCHPAWLGALHADPRHGISHGLLYGELARLAGADATIFPTYGGRFAFTETECRDLVAGTERPLGPLAPIFPSPAGGLTLARVPEVLAFYGSDTLLLIGGDLHRHGPELASTAARFVAEAERFVG